VQYRATLSEDVGEPRPHPLYVHNPGHAGTTTTQPMHRQHYKLKPEVLAWLTPQGPPTPKHAALHISSLSTSPNPEHVHQAPSAHHPILNTYTIFEQQHRHVEVSSNLCDCRCYCKIG